MDNFSTFNISDIEARPLRVVILGGGFISGAVQKRLSELKTNFLLLRSNDLDLTKPESGSKLKGILKPSDKVLFIAARAPVKSEQMLIENLLMAKHVCEALREVSLEHLIYISSDAVYSDSEVPISESSVCSPDNLHGLMHLTREVMLKQVQKERFCILRPTLVFGKDDPHNGYGPNRFLRLAKENQDIVLFGEGEELRDHIWVEDVAEVIVRSILGQAYGILNIVSGKVVSFKEIAECVASREDTCSKVICTTRNSPMPHNGYREFDNLLFKRMFPDLERKDVLDWISME